MSAHRLRRWTASRGWTVSEDPSLYARDAGASVPRQYCETALSRPRVQSPRSRRRRSERRSELNRTRSVSMCET